MRFLLIVVVTISIINLNVHYIFNLIIRGLVRRYCQSFSVLLNFASCKIFGDKMIIDEYWISSVIRRKKISEVQIKGGKFKKKWKLSREAKVVFSPFMMKWLFSLKYISAKSFWPGPFFPALRNCPPPPFHPFYPPPPPSRGFQNRNSKE